ncbi:sodium-dependent transporter [Mesosutterella sp. OilRF-GAM-744-9]|uniref:Sodium-dependent transporter n=1 Tax=Mesosutterella porci TaxID=2915351 RepID=A0ABS9MQT8_9BURK|nr:sodium-dependent transporter [Mesosutterella sp. oilRF-744-WT-GAM-9]MCG5030965.1 sodium-dependent transporter [Mesosutterella sp. oilRF-744-WT-GAM-9]
MAEKQTVWGSRLGFILASAGSAVGLGAIWKFPYMAGTNGGSVFMLPYIFFTLTIGVSLLLAEFAMGRAGRAGPMESLNRVCGRGWGIFGGIGVFTVFLILSFYSCVGGWCLKYLIDALSGRGLISDASLLGSYFGDFVSNAPESYLYLLAFLGATALVVLRGIQSGIERVAKILMPALFILMLILIVRGVTLPGGIEGVKYLFAPRWSDFNASALFNAMGFCFFSLSLGAGTMITYGSYLDPKADLPNSVAWVATLAIASAILGGLMILPAVFAFHLDPTAGPGLTFVTMPAIFAQMPLGQFFAVFFYICLFVAALTSSVSMLEACTALMTRRFELSRRKSILITLVGCAVVGLCATLSFGPWSEVKFFGKNIFDILDYVTSNIGMPLSSFGIAIAAAWAGWKSMKQELQSARPMGRGMLLFVRIMIGIVSPLFVLAVAAGSL